MTDPDRSARRSGDRRGELARLYGTSAAPDSQRAALQSGSVPVAVYGLGKLGLPVAAVFAEVTGNVVGVDVDPAVVERVDGGDCHVEREPGLSELVAETVAEGALAATTAPETAATRAAIHVVVVPTPLTDDREPDLAALDAATEAVGAGLAAGDAVFVECTVPPRTCEERVLPALEAASGLERGAFGLAYCPERTSSGRALADIRGAYPKVVGGVDTESSRVAELVYSTLTEADVLPVASATTAEAVKVFEGVYRDVNIALANELATFTDELGIDVRAAIDVANTQPYCDIHAPGPGVGGHCIPYYPYFLIEPFETDASLLETARSMNDSMPGYTVDRLADELAAVGTALDGADVVILGLTYRPGVEEIRASPAFGVTDELIDRGATVYGVDPVLDSLAAFEERGLLPLSLEALEDRAFDAAVLVTPHEEFEAIEWETLGSGDDGVVVIDGRDSLDAGSIAGASRLYTIGRGPRDPAERDDSLATSERRTETERDIPGGTSDV